MNNNGIILFMLSIFVLGMMIFFRVKLEQSSKAANISSYGIHQII